MKFLLLLVTFILVAYPGLAQKEVSAFGKIEQSDLEFTDCPFDPGRLPVS